MVEKAGIRNSLSSYARAYYKNSLDYIQQAWSNETAKWSTFEDAIASILQGGDNLLSMHGYAWLIFAVGYLSRKRTPPRVS